jgi:hypothetical protein
LYIYYHSCSMITNTGKPNTWSVTNSEARLGQMCLTEGTPTAISVTCIVMRATYDN